MHHRLLPRIRPLPAEKSDGAFCDGYLGSAIASGDFYSFATSLTLASDTQYFFYENAALGSIKGFNVYAGGLYYFSFTSFFSGAPNSMDFTVTGATTTTPEPSSVILLGTGILGLADVARRKFSRQ